MANVIFGGMAHSTGHAGTDVLICPGGAKLRYLAMGKKASIFATVHAEKAPNFIHFPDLSPVKSAI
jgi:hypothetical protein